MSETRGTKRNLEHRMSRPSLPPRGAVNEPRLGKPSRVPATSRLGRKPTSLQPNGDPADVMLWGES
jgi:hypothetical protein